MDKCKACGAEIRWITIMGTGKKMPVDAKEQTLVTKDGRIVRGHFSHFATCPYADGFRKPGGKEDKS